MSFIENLAIMKVKVFHGQQNIIDIQKRIYKFSIDNCSEQQKMNFHSL